MQINCPFCLERFHNSRYPLGDPYTGVNSKNVGLCMCWAYARITHCLTEWHALYRLAA